MTELMRYKASKTFQVFQNVNPKSPFPWNRLGITEPKGEKPQVLRLSYQQEKIKCED